MDIQLIILLIVLAVVAVIGIALLVYFVFIKRGVLKKKALKVIGDYDHEHSILWGEIDHSISRLKSIADVNILFIDQYNTWKGRFNEVRDASDANAQSRVNALKDAMENRHWKELRVSLPNARKEIDDYIQQVDALRDGLQQVFRPEDEANEIAAQTREQYRIVKQKFNGSADDLALVAESIGLLFRRIDALIDRASDAQNKANYTDAKELYTNQIGKLLTETGTLLDVLPKICLDLTNVLPDKISSLRHRYETLTAEHYPLTPIITPHDIDAMDEEAGALCTKVKSLNNTGVSAAIENLFSRIDHTNNAFDEEMKSKEIYEKESDSVYREQYQLSQDYVVLTNNIKTISTYYLLGSDELKQMEDIRNAIDASAEARTLFDNYAHSNVPQLYSVLVEKMRDLQKATTSARASYDAFMTYLKSLKENTNKAYASIQRDYQLVKEKEEAVRSLHVASLSERYAPRFDTVHQQIDALWDLLQARPINVKAMMNQLHDLETQSDVLFQEVDQVKTSLEKAEAAIVAANRFRMLGSAEEQTVHQAEVLFQNGSFAEAEEAANRVISAHKE